MTISLGFTFNLDFDVSNDINLSYEFNEKVCSLRRVDRLQQMLLEFSYFPFQETRHLFTFVSPLVMEIVAPVCRPVARLSSTLTPGKLNPHCLP